MGLIVVWMVMCFIGCRAAPPPRTGFLSSYDNLEKIDRTTYRYLSDRIAGYEVLVIDPIKLRVEAADSRLSAEQLEEVAQYFATRLTQALNEAGYPSQLGQSDVGYPEGALQVRIAITDARAATVLLNLHPGSKLTGAGTGGASMEGEIVDPATGRQLAAFVQSGRGSQFEFDQFSRLDDVKDVIDDWVEELVDELDAARQARE